MSAYKFSPKKQIRQQDSAVNIALRHVIGGTLVGLLCLTSIWSTARAESPRNPQLADSSWPQVHQGPWQQDSTKNPGPTSANQLGSPQYVPAGALNIGLLESPKYPNGERVLWGGTIDQIYKLAVIDGKLTKISSKNREGSLIENTRSPFAGGYTALRYDNTYLTAATRTILAYRDTNLGDMNSPISLYKQYEIPQNLVPDSGITPDQISGMNLLWDGRIAVVTRFGYVGVVDIETGRGTPEFDTLDRRDRRFPCKNNHLRALF